MPSQFAQMQLSFPADSYQRSMPQRDYDVWDDEEDEYLAISRDVEWYSQYLPSAKSIVRKLVTFKSFTVFLVTIVCIYVAITIVSSRTDPSYISPLASSPSIISPLTFPAITPPPIPPPISTFDWCYNCSHRCSNIVKAIDFHSSTIPKSARIYKLTEIAASLPRFFRGLDHLFLQDIFMIGRDENLSPFVWKFSNQMTRTFVDADMHLFNFGSFDNSLNEVIYDMNDFDQVLIGDYHVDLWRTSTSLVIHMQLSHLEDAEIDDIIRKFAKMYVNTLRSFIHNDDEVTYYLTANTSYGPIRKHLESIAKEGNRKEMLSQYTYLDHRRTRKFDLSHSDLEAATSDRVKELEKVWPSYLLSLGTCHRPGNGRVPTVRWVGPWQNANISVEEFMTIKSVAGRVGAGLGSVGQPRYFVLVEGPTSSQDDDIMLDIKREPVPEWWNFVREDVRWTNSFFRSQGHRVCVAIHALQVHLDPVIGFLDMSDGSYIVRSRSPYKGAVELDQFTDPLEYHEFSEQLAIITAVNHARGDDDYNPLYVPYSFEYELSQVIGDDIEEFADSLLYFARMNANRITEDYKCYLASPLAKEG